MKQPKKLTREMKELLSKHRLVATNWALQKETECTYTFIHKTSNKLKVISK